ncbi:MAG: OmpA family protein [Gallionellaceae bacterium]|nr:OmpA family protein [Gallionellaceae bacterium]
MKNLGLSTILLGVALSANAQSADFEGTYAGILVGNNTSSESGLSDKSSAYLGLKGGYNWNFSDILVGAEAFYDGHTSSYTHDDVGVDARLGLPMERWLPYAKLGVAASHPGERLHGGVGVEYSLTDRWSLNAEWTTDKKDSLRNNNIGIGFNYQYGGASRSAAVRAAADKAAAERAAAEKAAADKAAADKAAAEKAASEKAPVTKVEAEKAPVVKAATEKIVAEKAKDPLYKTIVDEKKITLEGASFASGSAVLNKSASAELAKAVEFAAVNKEADLAITGYTDDRGDAAKNVKLSAARAEAVKAYLIKNGVAADRLSAKGEGAANPVADNKTAEGRAKNRRVEIGAVVREEKKVLVK